MEYKQTNGGIQALSGNKHAGWVLTTINKQWTYQFKGSNEKRRVFGSKEAAQKAFENQYAAIIIFKMASDVNSLTGEQKQNLSEIVGAIDLIRMARDKDSLECVVVEHDWPEYEPTWEAIAKRVDGQCEHGRGMTDYCEPCGRVNNS